jgi:hypothetical protein
MTAEEQGFVLGRYRAKFPRDAFETKVVPRLEDLALRAPRVEPRVDGIRYKAAVALVYMVKAVLDGRGDDPIDLT